MNIKSEQVMKQTRLDQIMEARKHFILSEHMKMRQNMWQQIQEHRFKYHLIGMV